MILNKLKHYYLFIAVVLITLLATACSKSSTSTSTNSPLRETRFMMGTSITISLYDSEDSTILNQAFARIEELENTLSINKTNTLLDEVNDNAGIKSTVVTPDMFKLIQKGIYYSNLTNGSFDISIGPIVKLWNIGFPEARVPSQIEIDNALPLVDFSKIQLDETNQTVFLEEAGMKLDLGSIAKGYAADEVARILTEQGIHHALIDLGGNIYALGTKVDGSQWKVGIQDPFNSRGQIIGYLPTSNKSLVTSGIYERYLEQDGVTYHHLLNPDTGYPFDNEIAGVTIISDASIDGDALSTAIFSKGIEEGLNFVNTLEGIDAIFISKDKKVYITQGIKDEFILDNPNFTLAN